MKFEVSEDQQEKVEKWLRKRVHKRSGCTGIKEWAFSRSGGIGESLMVRCACGQELDATEYDLW